MAAAAPRIDSRLLAGIVRTDRPTQPIAETCRRVGELADFLELPRPSYEQIRVLVKAHRRRALVPGAGEILLDIAFRARSPEAIYEALDARDRWPRRK